MLIISIQRIYCIRYSAHNKFIKKIDLMDYYKIITLPSAHLILPHRLFLPLSYY